MKFDPLTKDVFTDKDEFVKTMHCPYNMSWDDLQYANSTMRNCSTCQKFIVDTEHMADEELLMMVRQHPETCLKIDLNQNNVKIISNGIFRER